LRVRNFCCTFAAKMTSTFYTDLYRWYERNKRTLPWRETEDPYLIWLSEIILQQTRVAQGLEYYMRFVKAFPRVEDLAQADEDRVLRLWQGLGYYSRARHLKQAAEMIGRTDRFPRTYEELIALPGVGEYTAGAILGFAYNQPYIAMDGNVYRVLSRLRDIAEPFDTSRGKKLFREVGYELLDRTQPRLYNSAIMEFGALYCTEQSPNCEHCPLAVYCMAKEHGHVELLPVRKPRPQLRNRYLNYTIYICRPTLQSSILNLNSPIITLLHQRQEQDIWMHLWEFPLQEQTAPWTTPVRQGEIELTHILSHQRLHARYIIKEVSELPQIPECISIAWHELDQYALSRLTLKALEKIAGL